VLREAARGSLLSIIIEKNVPVTMDDGVKLLADVYRPGSTDRCPVLLTRLPYNKEVGQMVSDTFDVLRAVQAGYAVVVQDTRGRFASDGAFKPFFNEAVDGASTIAWAASQPWSTGSVGMFGASYVGATQWTAATQAPPALRAIAPFVTTDQYYDSWAYQGGAFQLGFNLHWAFLSLALGEVARQMGTGAAGPEDLSAMIAALDDNDELYWRLPLRGPVELKDLAPYYDDWLDHPSYDQFWKATAPCESFGRIVVPALNVGGWYDIFLKGTLASYVGMKRQGGSEEARRRQRLVVGPWAHGAYTGWFPERSFGFLAATGNADITGLQLRWFDWLLKGVDTGLAGEKPVRLFVMGVNEWRDADDWPVPGTRYVDYFLHSGGQANSAAGDGLLSTNAPGDEPEDVYLYDPRHPVPTTGGATYLPGLFIGANAGPRDQRGPESRRDVLCYTTEPLAEPVEVIGPVKLVLHVSSSAPDTDFTGKLCDVGPDGTPVNLTDGILRARYREPLAGPSPMEPDRTYEITLDLVATANVFAAGHRIRLEVSSSNFPRFDRNTNTGGAIATEVETDFRPAVNRVHHRRSLPSRLVLPVPAQAVGRR
jgi:putative CocE/NonD family hydrolase